MNIHLNDVLRNGNTWHWPLETFFGSYRSFSGSQEVQLAGCRLSSELNVDLTDPSTGSPATRPAGVRLVTNANHIVDVMVPDAYIISVRVYRDETTAPPIANNLKLYYNTRSLVGDSFADLCKIITFGTRWEGVTQRRNTAVVVDASSDPIRITTTLDGRTALKAEVSLNTFELKIYCTTGTPDRWALVSHDKYLGRKLLLKYSEFDRDVPAYSTYWKRSTLPGCKFLGFGEKSGNQLCMNKAKLNFFNIDNFMYSAVYQNGSGDVREPLYHSNPFWLEMTPGLPAVGVFLDSVAPSFVDLSCVDNTQEPYLQAGTLLSRFQYSVIVQPSATELLELNCRMIGQGRLFPKWTLGYQQGKFGWKNKDDVIACAQTFRKTEIPVDAFNVDIDVQQDLTTFTVNGSFQGVFSALKDLGIKSSTNITPFIKSGTAIANSGIQAKAFVPNNYAAWPGERHGFDPKEWQGVIAYSLQCPSGFYPDLATKEASQWWQNQYSQLIAQGLEFVWQDMLTPDMQKDLVHLWRSFPFAVLLADNTYKTIAEGHKFNEAGTPAFDPKLVRRTPAICMRNQYALNVLKSTFYGWERMRPEIRPFIIGRGGCSGMHRFGALWTGDNRSTWEFLQTNVAQSLSLGMSGQYYAGADIGGFAAGSGPNGQGEGSWADPELLMRWHMAGFLLPWFRNHYSGSAQDPWPGGSFRPVKEFQEVWAFRNKIDSVPATDKFLYKNVLPVCKFTIELRYRLMQLLYDCMFNSVRSGIPIIRPLFINEGSRDPSLVDGNVLFNNDEYLVGSDILVAPILKKGEDYGQGHRSLYLPAGSEWYQFTNCFVPLDKKQRERQFLYESQWGNVSNPPFQALQNPFGGAFRIDNYVSHFWDFVPKYEVNLIYMNPIFLRAGCIIPSVELEQFVGERRAQGKIEPITINTLPGQYPGGPAQYDLYIDDDSQAAAPNRGSFDDKRGCKDQYFRFHITNLVKPGNVTRSVTVACENAPSDPAKASAALPSTKWLCVAFIYDPNSAWGLSKSVSISFNGGAGQAVNEVRSFDDLCNDNSDNAVAFKYSATNTIYVRIGSKNQPRNSGAKVVITVS